MRNKEILIKQELEGLAEANGGLLMPEAVVEFAKDPNTALHSRFEWDDTEAAQKYRLWQARQIIKVMVDFTPAEKKEYQVFVSMKTDRYNGGGYRQMVEIMSDEQSQRQLLIQAHADFRLWQRKYEQLKELAPVFAQMAEIMEQMIKV